MPDPKKKSPIRPSAKVSAFAGKKQKEYHVEPSKKQKRMEKDGRMQANRDAALKKDVEKAGGKLAYIKKAAAAQKRVAAQRPKRKAYESKSAYDRKLSEWKRKQK